jgi:anti-sigma factor RsiW
MSATHSPPVGEHDLHAFVDGELDGRRYRRVVAYLATDPFAAERVNEFLRQQGELSTLRAQIEDRPYCPDPRTEELIQELAGAVRHRRRVRLSFAGSGLAAAGLFASWLAWGPDPSQMAERLAWPRLALNAGPQVLFGRDPFGNMQLAGADGFDAGVDQQLAAYSLRRPDLASYGLHFVGGDALQGGETPAIRLAYEDKDGRRVFLFVGAVGSDADVALTLVPEGHISLNWRRGSLVFALIGPKDSQQLLDAMQATGELLSPPTLPGSEGELATAAELPATPPLGAMKPATLPAAEPVTTLGHPATAPEPSATPLPAAPAAVTEKRPKSL